MHGDGQRAGARPIATDRAPRSNRRRALPARGHPPGPQHRAASPAPSRRHTLLEFTLPCPARYSDRHSAGKTASTRRASWPGETCWPSEAGKAGWTDGADCARNPCRSTRPGCPRETHRSRRTNRTLWPRTRRRSRDTLWPRWPRWPGRTDQRGNRQLRHRQSRARQAAIGPAPPCHNRRRRLPPQQRDHDVTASRMRSATASLITTPPATSSRASAR
jgi:hypothetical protein